MPKVLSTKENKVKFEVNSKIKRDIKPVGIININGRTKPYKDILNKIDFFEVCNVKAVFFKSKFLIKGNLYHLLRKM